MFPFCKSLSVLKMFHIHKSVLKMFYIFKFDQCFTFLRQTVLWDDMITY